MASDLLHHFVGSVDSGIWHGRILDERPVKPNLIGIAWPGSMWVFLSPSKKAIRDVGLGRRSVSCGSNAFL